MATRPQYPSWTNPITGRLISPDSVTAKKLIRTGIIDAEGHSLLAPSAVLRDNPDPGADALAAKVHALEMERMRQRLALLESSVGPPNSARGSATSTSGRPVKNPPMLRRTAGRFTVDATDVSAAETTDNGGETDATDAPTSDDEPAPVSFKELTKPKKKPAEKTRSVASAERASDPKKSLSDLLAEISIKNAPTVSASADSSAQALTEPAIPFGRRWR